MRLKRMIMPALMLCGLLATNVNAQVMSDPMADDVYHVVDIDGGVLRIHRRTGDVSECRLGANGWICRLSADDRVAYEAEINRLNSEIQRLEGELAAAEEALEERRTLPLIPDAGAMRERLELPSDEEIDAAMDTTQQFIRRFFDLVRDMRAEMEAEQNL